MKKRIPLMAIIIIAAIFLVNKDAIKERFAPSPSVCELCEADCPCVESDCNCEGECSCPICQKGEEDA
jgi:hypothetical protein